VKPLVLDLTRLLPGPMASRVLGMLGFRVLRLLPPSGDLMAEFQPQTYAWLNEGKETVTLDLKTLEGKDRLFALAREAAVLFETNRPGVMERLGVGPEALRAVNPNLVYVRIAGFREPELRRAPGHDLTYLAHAGLLDHFGEAWRSLQLADVGGAMWAALAALEGLRRGGGFFEVYLSEAAEIFAYPKLPFLDGRVLCYATYPAADGAVALAALEPHLWRRFCQAAGKPHLAGAAFSPAEATNPSFLELRAFFAKKPRAEWEAWAQAHDLPIAAVRDYEARGVRLPWREY